MADRPTRPAGRYPHPTSILSYSRITHQLHDDGTVDGSMPILPDQLDAGGRVRLGALAPLVDSCAGVLAARAVAPDWCATLDFKLHLTNPPSGGRVHGATRALRVGKNTVLSENRLTDDDGNEIGVAHVTFSRLPAREDNHARVRTRSAAIDYSHPDEEDRLPFDEYYNLRLGPKDSISFELDHHERIYNSFGSIQGGAMGALLERGGTLAGDRLLGRPTRTVDLHFSYLAQATTGPFQVRAEPLRSGGEVLARVELLDRGNDDRVCAVGTARAVPIAPDDAR